jgi:hypothetical protein
MWTRWFGWLIALVLFGLPGWAGAAAADRADEDCPAFLSSRIPARSGHAMTASDFVAQTWGLSEPARERVVATELLRGNLPAFLRDLKPVTLRGRGGSGREVEITICVTPDYLALGSSQDFLRTPMGRPTAFRVANRFGFILPTPSMVDAIHEQAEVHLAPVPLPPTDQMRSTAYFELHQARIAAQRLAAGAPLGALIDGQKKDLVLSVRLRDVPGRVAIYGWYQRAGDPIQPLSTVHGARYADYSHGVRLVSMVARIDGGRPRSLLSLLEDPEFAPVLSDEGPIPGVDWLVHAMADEPGDAGVMLASSTGPRPAACGNAC